jgi:prepilin signal peptidase PulO-like enzyme (type II secretory pathway)
MIIIAFLLGMLLGVVINTAADSLPLSRRLERPRCLVCGAPRPPAQWSGIITFLSGKRNCEYCGSRRAFRAAWLEVLAGIGAVWILQRDPSPAAFLAGVTIAAIFLLVAVIDIEHRLILHPVSAASAVVIGAIGVLDPARGVVKTLAGGLAGLAIVLVLYWLGALFSKVMARLRGRELDEVAFGFGDVTLAGVIGLAVGWPGVVLALVTGIMAAGVFSLGYVMVMVLRGRYSAFAAIPYGPFLILGALLVYFGGRELFLPLA